MCKYVLWNKVLKKKTSEIFFEETVPEGKTDEKLAGAGRKALPSSLLLKRKRTR